jgi:putative membrane protein
MKGFHFSFPLIVLALFASPIGMAAESADPSLSSADRKFVKEAAIGGMAEVELATLASRNAGSDQVRQLAERIKQDHEQANQKLQSIASQNGAEVPAELDRKHKRDLDRLTKLQGAEFDREYVGMMVKEHKDDIKAFEKQADKGKDAELKAFAAQTTPKLREHLQQAQQLQSQMKSDDKSS